MLAITTVIMINSDEGKGDDYQPWETPTVPAKPPAPGTHTHRAGGGAHPKQSFTVTWEGKLCFISKPPRHAASHTRTPPNQHDAVEREPEPGARSP